MRKHHRGSLAAGGRGQEAGDGSARSGHYMAYGNDAVEAAKAQGSLMAHQPHLRFHAAHQLHLSHSLFNMIRNGGESLHQHLCCFLGQFYLEL